MLINSNLDYENYWDNSYTHNRHPSVRLRNRFILDQLTRIKFDSVVDVGCGDGYLINIIKENFPGKKLSGLDISKKIIEINKSKFNDINFQQLDISNNHLDFNDKQDVVICSEVIEHLVDWQIALKHLVNLINDKGYLILTTQSGKRYKNDIDNGHLQHYDLNFLENKLNDLGIRAIRSYKKGYPFYNLQKWLYDKNEGIAKDYQRGTKGMSFIGNLLFNIAYFLFSITPRSRKIGPQIFILARKEEQYL